MKRIKLFINGKSERFDAYEKAIAHFVNHPHRGSLPVELKGEKCHVVIGKIDSLTVQDERVESLDEHVEVVLKLTSDHTMTVRVHKADLHKLAEGRLKGCLPAANRGGYRVWIPERSIVGWKLVGAQSRERGREERRPNQAASIAARYGEEGAEANMPAHRPPKGRQLAGLPQASAAAAREEATA